MGRAERRFLLFKNEKAPSLQPVALVQTIAPYGSVLGSYVLELQLTNLINKTWLCMAINDLRKDNFTSTSSMLQARMRLMKQNGRKISKFESVAVKGS